MSGPDPADIWDRVLAWLRHAQEDARIARGCLDLVPPSFGGAAYHCQQAAEKLLKGFLVRANADFSRTHDLDRLAEMVVPLFPSISPLIAPMRQWTSWSAAYRYPGEADPEPVPDSATLEDALDQISRLSAVLGASGPASSVHGTRQ